MSKATKQNRQLSVAQALKFASGEMQLHSDSSSLDAQVLLAYILEVDRAWLLAHPAKLLSNDQVNILSEKLEEIKSGIPLPYVIASWEFFGLSFDLTSDVLIPRPETELLVETAISWLRNNPERRTALEVGTGSGCIAISIAANVPNSEILATDISETVLAVARKNVIKHHLEDRISLQQSDLLKGINGKFEIVCANLPYIPTSSLITLDVYQREPILALDGGEQGLRLISRLIEAIPAVLSESGLVLLEIDPSQAKSSIDLAKAQFPTATLDVLDDLSGRARLLRIQT